MRFGITFVIGEFAPSYENGKIIYGKKQKHTYEDWKLIPAKRPVIPYPEAKEQIVDVEAIDGDGIDLSESLAGHLLYKSREVELEFYRQQKDNWSGGIKDISNWIHGEKIKMVLDDDPYYFYEGRCTVSAVSSEQYYSKVTFKCKLSPWKMHVLSSDDIDNGLWDLINFDDVYGQSEFIWRRTSSNDVRYDVINIPESANAKVLDINVSAISPIKSASIGGGVLSTTIPARAKLSDGTYRDFLLPAVNKEGYTLYQLRIPPKTSVEIRPRRSAFPFKSRSEIKDSNGSTIFKKGDVITDLKFNLKFQISYRKGEL